MTRSHSLVLTLSLVIATSVLAQEVRRVPTASAAVRQARKAAEAPTRIVYIARYSPAKELAQALSQVMGPNERVIVGPNTVSNGLILSGSKDSIEKLVALVEALDAPPKKISIQITIAKLTRKSTGEKTRLDGPASEVTGKLRELTATGQLSILTQMSLSTLSNQQALVQVGERVALPTGTIARSPRISTRSYSTNSIGTMVRVMPRVAGDEVLMDIGVERSAVEKSDKKTDDKSSVPPSITSATGQTVVRVKNGHTTMLSSFLKSRAGKSEGNIVLVTVRIEN